jgi:hypothetical protein
MDKLNESRPMTEAEQKLLALALGYSTIQFIDDATLAAVQKVQRERVPEEAIAEYRQATMRALAANEEYRATEARLDLPSFLRQEIERECHKTWQEQVATRYVYTGVRASDEQERVMREAFSVPLIGRNAGGGPPPQKVVHDTALACGLPEIHGFYGYHFKRHEFVHEPGATEREPDEWKR